MFDLVKDTWNPLGGKCYHNCNYCWSMGEKGLVKRYDMKKYKGPPRLIEGAFKKKFKPNTLVFVCDMCDLFANWIPSGWIRRVIDYTKRFPKTWFLFLTKNPMRYLEFKFPPNAILGSTIETDMASFNTPSAIKNYTEISNAPLPASRIKPMIELTHAYKMLSLEPILDFSISFPVSLRLIEPKFVYIGYDNYGYKLPEPPLNKADMLVSELRKFTTVYWKTRRKAWWEL